MATLRVSEQIQQATSNHPTKGFQQGTGSQRTCELCGESGLYKGHGGREAWTEAPVSPRQQVKWGGGVLSCRRSPSGNGAERRARDDVSQGADGHSLPRWAWQRSACLWMGACESRQGPFRAMVSFRGTLWGENVQIKAAFLDYPPIFIRGCCSHGRTASRTQRR